MTYYYVKTSGNNGNTGLSEGQAWKTIQYAIDNIPATGQHTIWVKNDGTYTEKVTINRWGSSSNFIRIEGYSSSINDNGVVILDASGLTNGFINGTGSGSGYFVFANIEVKEASGTGFEFTARSKMQFINCRSHNNSTYGFRSTSDSNVFVNCIAYNNSSYGFYVGLRTLLIWCKSYGNGASAMRVEKGSIIYGCLLYDLANVSSGGIYMVDDGSTVRVIHCTIDGENQSNPRGIYFPLEAPHVTFHNLIYDCYRGFEGGSGSNRPKTISDYNGFASISNSDTTNWDSLDDSNDVTQAGDPFINSASRDYTLHSSNGVNFINAGYDIVNEGNSEADIGASQNTTQSAPAGFKRYPGLKGHMEG